MGRDIRKEFAIAKKIVEVALLGEKITYGELRDTQGVGGHCLALRFYLADIGHRCQKDDCQLPLIVSIVVNKKHRIPGKGFFTEFDKEYRENDDVFNNQVASVEQSLVYDCKDWSNLLESYPF